MQNETVGLLNVVAGTFVLLLQLLAFLVISKLGVVYDQFGAKEPAIMKNLPLVLLIVALVVFYFMYVGVKLARGDSSDFLVKQGKVGLFFFVAIFVLSAGSYMVSFFLPLYNLSSSL